METSEQGWLGKIFSTTKRKLLGGLGLAAILLVAAFLGNSGLFTGSVYRSVDDGGTLDPTQGYVKVEFPEGTTPRHPYVTDKEFIHPNVAVLPPEELMGAEFDIEIINLHEGCLPSDCNWRPWIRDQSTTHKSIKSKTIYFEDYAEPSEDGIWQFAFRMVFKSDDTTVTSLKSYIKRGSNYAVDMTSSKITTTDAVVDYVFTADVPKNTGVDLKSAELEVVLELGSDPELIPVTVSGFGDEYKLFSEGFVLPVSNKIPLVLKLTDEYNNVTDHSFELIHYDTNLGCNSYVKSSPRSQSDRECDTQRYAPLITVNARQMKNDNGEDIYRVNANYVAINGLRVISMTQGTSRIGTHAPATTPDSDGHEMFPDDYDFTFDIPIRASGSFEPTLYAEDKYGLNTEITHSYTATLIPDTDDDGIADDNDNCPNVSNASQLDTDSNGTGDACEIATPPVDTDNDGIADDDDNCPNVSNASQLDTNSNGLGDACEIATPPVDTDNDGIADGNDNCPNISNPSQLDTDSDGVGDACDTPVDPVCATEGQSLGATHPDNTLGCCEGLVPYFEDDTPPGSGATCVVPDDDDDGALLTSQDLVGRTETSYVGTLDMGSFEIDTFQATIALGVMAEDAVSQLEESAEKTNLLDRLALLNVQIAKHSTILSEYNTYKTELDVTSLSQEDAQSLLLKLIVLEAKANLLPDSELKDALLADVQLSKDKLNEFISNAPTEEDEVTIDISDPIKPRFALTKPSTRTVLNLYSRTSGDPAFVDFIDQNVKSTLNPGVYQCYVGHGCELELGERPIFLEPGVYFYRLQVDVEGTRLTAESDDFTLSQPYDSRPFVAPVAAFADVSPTSPIYPAVKFVAETGIMTGSTLPDGTLIYRPDERMLRTEVFAISNRIAGVSQRCQEYRPEIDGNLGFVDLNNVVYDPAARWYLQQIKCSRDLGSTIVQGYSDGTVQALKEIVWAESVKVVLESARVGRATIAQLPVFSSNVQPWWSGYYQFVNSRQIVIPDGLTPITRGQFAQLLYALHQKDIIDGDLIRNNIGFKTL